MTLRHLIFVFLLSSSFLVKADLRWYDIELIFFERPVDEGLTENFSQEKLKSLNFDKSKNIIKEAYQEISLYDHFSCVGLHPLLEDITDWQNETFQLETNTETEQEVIIDTEQGFITETAAQLNNINQSASSGSVIEQDLPVLDLNTEINTEEELPKISKIDYYCPKSKPISELVELPLSPFSLSKEHTENIYLLSSEQLELNNIVKNLKRKGLDPLLHTGWRQPESNIRNATPIYLFGGENITATIKAKEEARALDQLFNNMLDNNKIEQAIELDNTTDENSFSKEVATQDLEQTNAKWEEITLNSKLTEVEMVNQTWQLQGIFKVFIRKNYLNIHADFDLNELSSPQQERLNTNDKAALTQPISEPSADVSTTHFSQKRRVISSQLHYFDHPRLGIIMQIRRYNH